MYLVTFLANFVGFCVFLWISRDFADLLEIRGFVTARNIRSPGILIYQMWPIGLFLWVPSYSCCIIIIFLTPQGGVYGCARLSWVYLFFFYDTLALLIFWSLKIWPNHLHCLSVIMLETAIIPTFLCTFFCNLFWLKYFKQMPQI